jgi:hypothetical protein
MTADDDLHAELLRVLAEVDPTPDKVYGQARARFHARTTLTDSGSRSAPPVADLLPDQTPGGAAAPDNDAALPGYQRPAHRLRIVPARPVRWSRLLRRLLRAVGWLIAGVLLVVAAIGGGFLFGLLALLYGGPF